MFLASLSARLPGIRIPSTVETFWREIIAHFSARPSVLAALDRLRTAGWRIAVVANGSPMQADKVEAAGLRAYVDAVCVSEVEGVAKPDPELLHIAAERAGGVLRGAWLVGDSASDIEAAVAAGVSSVWVRRAGKVWQDQKIKTDHEVESFEHAVALIEAVTS